MKRPIKPPRMIHTEYSGGVCDRVRHSVTLQGALRSAVVKIATGQHVSAAIYDCRFGHRSLAILLHTSPKGVLISWPRKPKWEVA